MVSSTTGTRSRRPEALTEGLERDPDAHRLGRSTGPVLDAIAEGLSNWAWSPSLIALRR